MARTKGAKGKTNSPRKFQVMLTLSGTELTQLKKRVRAAGRGETISAFARRMAVGGR